MNSKRIGNIGEAAILNKFVELQIPVYIPFGDNEKADLIAEFNGKLNKIQVKTSLAFDDVAKQFVVSLTSTNRIKGKADYHKYIKEEIDYFAVYNIQSKIALLLPICKFENRKGLKISVPCKRGTRNQFELFNYEDYTFEKIIKY